MTLLFCDGFDHYTTKTEKGWSEPNGGGSSIQASAARYGTNGLRATALGGATEGPTQVLPVGASGVVGFACRLETYVNVNDTQLYVNEGTTRHLIVYWDGTFISVKRGDGTVLGTGTKKLVPINVWHYYELKFTIGDSGSFELRVDGETSTSGSSVDTKNGGTGIPDRVSLGSTSNGSSFISYDDVYIASGSTFYGDIRVQSIFPSGAGNTTQMTPSAGSNYACVDETAPNSDTDYVSETTAGEKDTYAFGNLTPTSGTVKGVQVLVNARKDDAGSRTIAPVYRPVSTDYDGTTVAVSDSYSYSVREITEISPETSVAWTIAEINGAEFGVTLKA